MHIYSINSLHSIQSGMFFAGEEKEELKSFQFNFLKNKN